MCAVSFPPLGQKARVVKLLSGTSFASLDLLLPSSVVAKRQLERRQKREAAALAAAAEDAGSDDDDDVNEDKPVDDPNETAADALSDLRTAPLDEIAEAIAALQVTLVEKDQGCVVDVHC